MNFHIFSGHRVVVRSDIQKVIDSGLVTVICGGGSGHEPFAAGFVGEGMLSAAVAGSVFASPPPTSILAAIKAVQSPGWCTIEKFCMTGVKLHLMQSFHAKVNRVVFSTTMDN